MKIPEKIPEWLAALPKDALLTTKDLCQMFGYKNTGNIARLSGDSFPPADYHGGEYYKKDAHRYPPILDKSPGSYGALRWKASTIRNFIRQQNLK